MSACQRKLWLFEELTTKNKAEFWWLAFRFSRRTPPRVPEQHYPLAAWLPVPSTPRVPAPGALWLSQRWAGAPAAVPRPFQREGAEPRLPRGSSRCQHSTAAPAGPPPGRRAEGRASASLSATFVFLISFYFKVYQLLYYQAELSLQSLPLSSSFPFFCSSRQSLSLVPAATADFSLQFNLKLGLEWKCLFAVWGLRGLWFYCQRHKC